MFNHIALAVTDLDAAVAWYQGHFGFRKIRSFGDNDRDVNPDAPIFKIYPASMQKVRIAFMACGNDVGFELFEFKNPDVKIVPPERKDDDFEYTRAGVFHFGITVPDPAAKVKELIADGSKLCGDVVQLGQHSALYCLVCEAHKV